MDEMAFDIDDSDVIQSGREPGAWEPKFRSFIQEELTSQSNWHHSLNTLSLPRNQGGVGGRRANVQYLAKAMIEEGLIIVSDTKLAWHTSPVAVNAPPDEASWKDERQIHDELDK